MVEDIKVGNGYSWQKSGSTEHGNMGTWDDKILLSWLALMLGADLFPRLPVGVELSDIHPALLLFCATGFFPSSPRKVSA
jgi:hypothetical protein